MDFKALEYICAISDFKTISAAAKSLFISQPALSQYLNKTEQELGTQLFYRSGSCMIPTVAGTILIREGRTLLASREALLGQLSTFTSEATETLRFGISPFYSKYYLPTLIQHYRENYPQIQLDIVEMSSEKLEKAILAGELNLAFLPTDPVVEGLNYRPVAIEEIMIALPANHPLNSHAIPSPERPYLDLSLLRNEPFVGLEPSCKFYRMHQRILKHFSIQPNMVYESTNWDTVCMLVARGIGVGMLPGVLIHKHLVEPNFYRISGIDCTRSYSAVYREGTQLTPLELALVETFMELLKTINT